MSISKDGNIQITSDEFTEGIARSPYLGIQQMVNLDIHNRPGVLRIARRLEKESGSTVTGKLRFGGVDYNIGNFYGLDNDGELYERDKITESWSVANSFGSTDQGCVVWKNYALAFRGSGDSIIESYGPLSGGTASDNGTMHSFSNDASSVNTDFITYVSLDDRVYVGMDNVLHEIVQVDGQDFDPTDGTTFSVNEDVLILPEGIVVTSISEAGTDILVGTNYGDTQTVADLFVWNPNKSGTDTASPDQRIPFSGNGIQHVTLSDNRVYAVIGENANLKESDLTNVNEVIQVNDTSNNPETTYTYNQKGEAMANHNGGFVFGLQKDAAEPVIYQLKNGALTSFDISEGQVDAGIRVGKVQSLTDDKLLVAWENQTGTSTYGVDVTSDDTRYQNYSAYFVSQMYPVGRHLREKTYQYIGFILGKKLQADQGIRIKYRTSLNDSFTTIGTWDYDTYGDILAYEDNANLPTDLTNLQLRVELTTGTSDNTPELLSIYVI